MASFGKAICGAAVTLALLAQGTAWAGPTADIDAGREFAEAHCGRCHATGEADASAHPAAPPFRELARRWPLENLAEALAEGISVGHPDMPEFTLGPQEIDDFLGYLEAISASR